MKNKKLNTLIKISLLSVMALVLMFFEFQVPLFPDFLKIDISDLPALLGAFALGPMAGVGIELFKNILHVIFKGTTSAMIGESANFVVGSVLVYTAGIIYKRKKSKANAVKGIFVGVVAMSLVAGVLNYYVFLPLYETVLGFPIKAIVGMGSKVNPNVKNLITLILWSIVPFNLIKGIVIGAITLPIYKSVSPVLHKEEIVEKDKALKERTQN